MADIRPFKKSTAKKTTSSNVSVMSKHKPRKPSHTLCKSGFHKWQVDTATDFAVKQGKLLTHYRCARCGEIKVENH